MARHSFQTNEIIKPSVAGRFYPADPQALKEEIRTYLTNAEIEPARKQVLAVLAPHAGYVFSGPTAGYSYKYIQQQKPDTVLLIGLAHQGVEHACVFNGEGFETPLGRVEVDAHLVESLLAGDTPIQSDARPFKQEHSIEVNLPFVQMVFPDAQVASILITRTDPDLCRRVGAQIAEAVKSSDKSILIVVSSDMSHYPAYETAQEVDRAMLKSLETLDPAQILDDLSRLENRRDPNLHCVMCGSAAMLAAVEAAKTFGNVKGQMLHYSNSGDTPFGEHSRVVGYGSFAIYQDEKAGNSGEETQGETKQNEGLDFTDEDKKELLAIARRCIADTLQGIDFTPHSESSHLRVERGVFVTLHNHGDLRGCLGRFEPGDMPLYQLVGVLAVESAQHDYRFSTVTLDELPDIDIQVSVLSPLMRVRNIEEIEIGKHGLQIRGRTRLGRMSSGTLLPQVATERNWDVQTFLESTCVKAGLSADTWKDESTEIYKYSAEIFGDLDFSNPPYTVGE